MIQKRDIVRQSIPDILVHDILERILNGEFQEGDQIRQELIAEEYAVSRMPVCEALRRLEAEGLVSFPTHKGATVTELSIDDIREIFDLRALLEVDALHHAIPALTQQDMEECEAVLVRLKKPVRPRM